MQVLTDPPHGAVAVRSLPDLQTESLLRSILHSIDHGVLLTDLDHRSLACNRRFGEIFGVDPEEAVRMDVEELRARVAPRIVRADEWRENLGSVYAAPEARFEDEIVLRGESGDVVMRRVASPVYDERGELLGRLWTFSDVTEAHQRRRNAELLRLVSTLSNPDPGANLKAICEAVTLHFGGAATQLNILEGDFLRFHFNAGDLGPAQHIPGIMRWETYCGFTLADDKPLIVQNALLDSRCANLLPASVGFCRYMGVPVRDESGQAIGTLCIVDEQMEKPLSATDIELMELIAMRVNAELARERYLAERIAERERGFEAERRDIEETRHALDTMNEVFAGLFGGHDTVELLRRTAERLREVLGYEASAVFLRRPDETCCDIAACPVGSERAGVSEGAFPSLADCATDGASLDVSFVRVEGGEVGRLLGLPWAAVACLPKGDWGEAVVALGRAEEPPGGSARHRVKLLAVMDGVRVVLAAHALTTGLAQANVALKGAQEKALRSEKLAVVGTLAASTAHDIRNITASLSMLAADASDPAVSLTAVREQLDRFNVLAHRLLSYARPGQTQSHPVDLAELLDRVLSLTAGQRRVSRVEAELDLPPDLPPVLGDGHQLQHLFVNLVLNAVQAMDRTGGHLRLEAHLTPERIMIRVIDDGPGIPESVAARLFQPFASSRPQGFGLGLFSANRIVEAHGGTIEALRNEGRGSTFLVGLPVGGERR